MERGGQDIEVIKDRFIRMQMMRDAQSGRMNPQAKSGLKHKLNNNLGHAMLISIVNSIHKAGNKWNQVTPEPTKSEHWRIKDKESRNKKRPREDLDSQLASTVEGQIYDSSI